MRVRQRESAQGIHKQDTQTNRKVERFTLPVVSKINL